MSDEPWSSRDSEALYRLAEWGKPYFSASDAGRLRMQPGTASARAIDIHALALEITARGIELPFAIHFDDILASRIEEIHGAFSQAIANAGYLGRYTGVFPIKVNQQRPLVEQMVRAGAKCNLGLEVGSKAELLVALPLLTNPEQLLICNGYKDRQYVSAALSAERLGHRPIIVLERPEELTTIIEAAAQLGQRPRLGLRAKLNAEGHGRWAASTGHRSKFGMSSVELVDVVNTLRAHDMLDTVEMLHFHIGSQVSNIVGIKRAVREASRLYSGLSRLGCFLKYLNVGGGLAVDYIGGGVAEDDSRNYTLDQYCADVVTGVLEACRDDSVPEPDLVSESGRALSAQHALLVFEVLSMDEPRAGGTTTSVSSDASRYAKGMLETLELVRDDNLKECWYDAVQWQEEARSSFELGHLSLEDLAEVERLFARCCEAMTSRSATLPPELSALSDRSIRTFNGNFSVFQSIPDSWAIDQVFPVVPLSRLDEEPTVRAVIADLTCDSDGMLHEFVGPDGVQSCLRLHELREDEPYLIAVCLTGAYQETLGGIHNLFGNTNTVYVALDPDGDGYTIGSVCRGDTTTDVLRRVHYEPSELVETLRKKAEHAIARGEMTASESRLFLEDYKTQLRAYTYLGGRGARPSQFVESTERGKTPVEKVAPAPAATSLSKSEA